MKNIIVICTNNLVPPLLFRKVLTNAFTQADMVGDTFVSVVSHYPVFDNFVYNRQSNLVEKQHKQFSDVLLKTPIFDPSMFSSQHANIVVGECEYNCNTIYSQLLLGTNFDRGNVIIMEHDVLYPINYLKIVSSVLNSGLDACYWNSGKFFSENGFYDVFGVMTLSRFAMRWNSFRRVYENKLEKGIAFVEPGLKGIVNDENREDIITDNFAMLNGLDTIDVRHGLNVSGNYLVDSYSDYHEYWGSAEEIKPLIHGTYGDFVEKHPTYGYGTGD